MDSALLSEERVELKFRGPCLFEDTKISWKKIFRLVLSIVIFQLENLLLGVIEVKLYGKEGKKTATLNFMKCTWHERLETSPTNSIYR